MNKAYLQRAKELVWVLERALRRAAGAVTRSTKENGPRHVKTIRLQKRATAFAEALLHAKAERKERAE